ncbi:hypothetical protein C5167_010302 [Papaver somniferum]|uniref:Uncharacterized protein n=1 Tax=Papaver somniferum TaxID=3469 RepID=A0A4Y7K3S0_PAPSO|nr:hypothetical protein C5167_010302 [Papaver somniferum]
MSVFAEADNKVEEKIIEEDVEKGGELLFCGGTNWDTLGRKGPTDGNLISPTRLRPLIGVNIRFVAAGCVSCHCVALDVEGRVYTWGRNEKGQLGHGDMIQRDRPTVVSGLSKHKIMKAGAGRAHTVVVTNDGKSFAFGWNKHGQCGTGSAKNEFEQSPVSSQVSEVTNVVCGGDFTVWLSSVEGSSILTAGLPQYGQLGHGTDNEYNTKDSSVKHAYEAQPRPKAIAAFAGKTVVKVACGTNHTGGVMVAMEGWGIESRNEWTPRVVDVFQRQNILPPNAVVAAGALNCAVTAGGGQMYMWGKIKSTGDDWMYAKPLMDLSGWNIRCMDSGATHNFVGADQSCISWGHSQNGELGYGPKGPKSSANPKKVDSLEGMHVMSVACGSAYSMVIVDRTNVGDKLDQLDVYDGKASEEGTAEPKAKSPAPKKGGAKVSSNKRKKSKDSSDSENEDDESDDGGSENESDDDENGHVEEKKRGGGRGGRGNGAKKPVAGKGTGRGRGRPPSAEKKSTQLCGGGTGGKRGRPRKS